MEEWAFVFNIYVVRWCRTFCLISNTTPLALYCTPFLSCRAPRPVNNKALRSIEERANKNEPRRRFSSVAPPDMEKDLNTLYKMWSFERARVTFWDIHKWISVVLVVRVVVTVVSMAMSMIAKKKMRASFLQSTNTSLPAWADADLWNCKAMWTGTPTTTQGLNGTFYPLVFHHYNDTQCLETTTRSAWKGK